MRLIEILGVRVQWWDRNQLPVNKHAGGRASVVGTFREHRRLSSYVRRERSRSPSLSGTFCPVSPTGPSWPR